ncbi:transmembrane protein, putative [Medicago truncatula]|uniref:Transmembrane protein, putative n=1 Tax=Medicago truncatula TaxID=3880 RepID=A0A072U919_MEDTR|nr:transmembrane protein, putative [Medicago truncatula]
MEEEEEVILQITRVLICTKLMKDLEIDQFQFAKASNKIRVVFLVSNGVMPCVLGPTSFNLKFWANILISDEHQNVVVFMMIFIWVHHVLHLGGFSGILHLHAHALRDCVVLVQYQLSDVSISC